MNLNDTQTQLCVEQIMPGIYLTNSTDIWIPERLPSHGFTHIINIDRHIQDYAQGRYEQMLSSTTALSAEVPTIPSSSPLDTSSNISSPRYQNRVKKFETLDLNFGEASYLTTVLPNCYKAVKFIDKALKNGGAILFVDRNGHQKCVTIVVGFLMYKYNINFNEAFQRVRKVFKDVELEKFYVSQLYEYEPILQVQRAQARGHSCSGELRSSFLKRKKLYEDGTQHEFNYNHHHLYYHNHQNNLNLNGSNFLYESSDVAME